MTQPLQSPELRLGDVPNLCSYGKRPLLMTGLFVQLLRQAFAAAQLIEEPMLRGGPSPPVWTPDPLTSGLAVESATTWKPQLSMARPALVVRRNGWQVTRLGIGDRLQGYAEDIQGDEHYSTFLQGSHTVFAIGDELQPEVLAAEVYRGMIQFGPVVRRYFNLHRFVVAEIGPMGRLQEAEGSYAVPVTVAYAFEDGWRVTPQSPYLQHITLSSILGAA